MFQSWHILNSNCIDKFESLHFLKPYWKLVNRITKNIFLFLKYIIHVTFVQFIDNLVFFILPFRQKANIMSGSQDILINKTNIITLRECFNKIRYLKWLPTTARNFNIKFYLCIRYNSYDSTSNARYVKTIHRNKQTKTGIWLLISSL